MTKGLVTNGGIDRFNGNDGQRKGNRWRRSTKMMSESLLYGRDLLSFESASTNTFSPLPMDDLSHEQTL